MEPDARYLGYFEKRAGKYVFIPDVDPANVVKPEKVYKGLGSGAVHYLERERHYLTRKVRAASHNR